MKFRWPFIRKLWYIFFLHTMLPCDLDLWLFALAYIVDYIEKLHTAYLKLDKPKL